MERKCYPTPKGTICYWVNEKAGEGPTLVFLPGLTADRRLFAPQLAYFAKKYRCLVWDAPGHGASRPFALDFTLMDAANWLYAILEREQAAPFYLVGQSMGGYVAQCLMEAHPGTAGGFMAIDSAPLQRRYVTALELWLLRHCEPVYRLYPWARLCRDGARGCAVTEEGRRNMAEMMAEYTKEEYCRLAGHGFRMLAQAMAADRPYRIDCPALLLCGMEDRAGSARRYNQAWARETGLTLVWIEGAGHNATVDRPETVNRALEAFVASAEAERMRRGVR